MRDRTRLVVENRLGMTEFYIGHADRDSVLE